MLSFDITDRNIRIIKGTENNGRIRINASAQLELEEGIIENGHIKDVARLATLINQVLRTEKMPDKEAIISISSNMTIFKELQIQKVDKQAEFAKNVRAEMLTALSLKEEDNYSVSYIVVGDSEEEENHVKVLATACPYEVVDGYKRLFNMLQIQLRSVMVGCNCITKVLLADAKVRSQMPLLAVQIDNNFISLNLYEDGQLSFSRFASISAEDYNDSEDYVFEAVNENIYRMIQFQRSKGDVAQIENVVFYGDTHEFVRLTNELEKMNIHTRIIAVPPQIHGYENLEFSLYANAIGALFKRDKDKERVNLLETDTVNNNRVKSDSSYTKMLLFSLLGTAAIMTVITLVLVFKNQSLQSQIDELKEKDKSPLKADLDAQVADLQTKRENITSYLDNLNDALLAYKSRPYPTSESYSKIEDTIHNTVTEAFAEEISADSAVSGKDRTQADFSNYYSIDDMNYSEGTYSLSLTLKAKDDEPFQTLPATLIENIRNMPEVANVAYNGYDIGEETVEGAPTTPEPGTPEGGEGTQQPNTQQTPTQQTVRVVTMDLQILVKGDDITDLISAEGETTEEEAAS